MQMLNPTRTNTTMLLPVHDHANHNPHRKNEETKQNLTVRARAIRKRACIFLPNRTSTPIQPPASRRRRFLSFEIRRRAIHLTLCLHDALGIRRCGSFGRRDDAVESSVTAHVVLGVERDALVPRLRRRRRSLQHRRKSVNKLRLAFFIRHVCVHEFCLESGARIRVRCGGVTHIGSRLQCVTNSTSWHRLLALERGLAVGGRGGDAEFGGFGGVVGDPALAPAFAEGVVEEEELLLGLDHAVTLVA